MSLEASPAEIKIVGGLICLPRKRVVARIEGRMVSREGEMKPTSRQSSAGMDCENPETPAPGKTASSCSLYWS